MVIFYFFSPNAALDIGFEKIFTATKKVCYGVVTHGCGLKDYFSLINLKHKKISKQLFRDFYLEINVI